MDDGHHEVIDLIDVMDKKRQQFPLDLIYLKIRGLKCAVSQIFTENLPQSPPRSQRGDLEKPLCDLGGLCGRFRLLSFKTPAGIAEKTFTRSITSIFS